MPELLRRLVSVGTGTVAKADDTLRPGDMNLLYSAKSIPAELMSAALNEQDLLFRVFGRCRHGASIDREVGDLLDNGDGVDGPGLPGERGDRTGLDELRAMRLSGLKSLFVVLGPSGSGKSSLLRAGLSG